MILHEIGGGKHRRLNTLVLIDNTIPSRNQETKTYIREWLVPNNSGLEKQKIEKTHQDKMEACTERRIVSLLQEFLRKDLQPI